MAAVFAVSYYYYQPSFVTPTANNLFVSVFFPLEEIPHTPSESQLATYK